MCFPRKGANFSDSRTSMPACTRPGRPECFVVWAGVLNAPLVVSERTTAAVRVSNCIRRGTGTTLRHPNSNDIVERYGRSCVVHLMCVCYIQLCVSVPPKELLIDE